MPNNKSCTIIDDFDEKPDRYKIHDNKLKVKHTLNILGFNININKFNVRIRDPQTQREGKEGIRPPVTSPKAKTRPLTLQLRQRLPR